MSSANELAEKSAQFAAFTSTLPFNNTIKSGSDLQYSILNEGDPLRRSTNSLSSELSQENTNNNNNNNSRGDSMKLTLPTIVETNRESSTIEQELDEKNKRAEKAK